MVNPGINSSFYGSTNVSFAQSAFEPIIPFGNPEIKEKEPEDIEEKIEFLINRINPDVEKCHNCKKWVDVTEEGVHIIPINSEKLIFCKECFKIGSMVSYGSFAQGYKNNIAGYNSYAQNSGTFTQGHSMLSTAKPIGHHPQFSTGTNKKWTLMRE